MTLGFAVALLLSLGMALPEIAFAAEVPDPPTFQFGPAVGTDALTFSWQAPASDGGSPITSYLVEYSRRGSSDWTQIVTAADATSVVIQQSAVLPYGTFYFLRVAAVNVEGTSNWSNEIQFQSLTAPGAPELTAPDIGYEEIGIRMSPNGSPSTSTTVTAEPGGHKCVLTGGQAHCIFSDLIGGQKYTFTGVSKNPAGTSPTSAALTAVSVGTATAVRSLKATVVRKSGVTSIDVTWKAPSNLRGGKKKGVLYTAIYASPTDELHPWRTSLVIGHVHRHYAYTIRIAAVTVPGAKGGEIYGAVKSIKVKTN